MDILTITFGLILIIILLSLILILHFKEKMYFNKHKILVNELKIKLTEEFINFSKLLECATEYSKISSETIGNLLEFLKDEHYSYMLVSNLSEGNLIDFKISFTVPYDGYLSFECNNCEINIGQDMQFVVKSKLKDYFLKKDTNIILTNIKNLRMLNFIQKNEK